MSAKTEQGYLVLADISGYTSFLAKTELEHAHEILSELLEVIVEQFTTLLSISKLEGDAVFAYVPVKKIERGETLLEMIESTYAAFRDRQTAMHRKTTCTCNACRNIPTLDLKFFAHYGEYLVQNVAGRSEIVSSDVNLAHRLMKNHVAEETGWHGYALFSDNALQKMDVQPENIHVSAETYEHLGEVKTHSIDMRKRYDELKEAKRVLIGPEEADFKAVFDYAAPPPVVWEWLNDPRKGSVWRGVDFTIAAKSKGRVSSGARFHCAHGKMLIVESVLDWRPFDYYTTDSKMPDKPMPPMIYTYKFEPTATGTRMHLFIKVDARLPKLIRKAIVLFIMKAFGGEKAFQGLTKLIADENAKQEKVEAIVPAQTVTA
jgi:hypothetical protein